MNNVKVYKQIEIQYSSKCQMDEFMRECYKARFYKKKKDKINIYRWNTSYWNKNSSIKKRSIETIYLEKKIKDDIMTDIKQFIKPQSKKEYERFGIPYKRNYLFSGRPGTGKTSFIFSIASELGYSLYTIPFTTELTDSTFVSALRDIQSNSILVLEDIDSLFEERNGKDSNMSFSGLINALDGLTYRNGLLIFMTTNYIDKIDDAILRPGRVDKHLKFDYAKPSQIKQMCIDFLDINSNITETTADTTSDTKTETTTETITETTIKTTDTPMKRVKRFIKQMKKAKTNITTAILQKFFFELLNDNRELEDKSTLLTDDLAKKLQKLAGEYIKEDDKLMMYNQAIIWIKQITV